MWGSPAVDAGDCSALEALSINTDQRGASRPTDGGTGVSNCDIGAVEKGCGNGIIDPGEGCDTAIPQGEASSCQNIDCNDGNICTIDTVVLSGQCQANCTHTEITEGSLEFSDNCCPDGHTQLTDIDCRARCGDGVLDSDEYCDTGIPQGQTGACGDCDDGISCTIDGTQGPAWNPCQIVCTHIEITGGSLDSSDDCCPTGHNQTTDTDCSTECGDGVLDSGESCDTAIAAGSGGACPESCDDEDSCTEDTLVAEGSCDAACSFTGIISCLNDDNCCPNDCNHTIDNDCEAPPPEPVTDTTEDNNDETGNEGTDLNTIGDDDGENDVAPADDTHKQGDDEADKNNTGADDGSVPAASEAKSSGGCSLAK